MKKIKTVIYFILFVVLIQLSSCTSPYYATKYQAKNMTRFSVAKTNGVQRHFLKKPKQKLNPSFTKHAKDWFSN